MKNLCLFTVLIALAMTQGSLRAEDRVPDVSEDPFFAAAVDSAIEDLSESSSTDDDEELLSEIGDELSLGADPITGRTPKNDKKSQTDTKKTNSTEDRKERLKKLRKEIVDEAIKKTLAIVRAKAPSLVAKAIKPVNDRLNVLEGKKTLGLSRRVVPPSELKANKLTVGDWTIVPTKDKLTITTGTDTEYVLTKGKKVQL